MYTLVFLAFFGGHDHAVQKSIVQKSAVQKSAVQKSIVQKSERVRKRVRIRIFRGFRYTCRRCGK